MTVKKRQLKPWFRRIRLNLLVIAAFLVMAVLSLHLLQKSILENSWKTGVALSRSYTVREEENIAAYELLMDLEGQYLDAMVREGAGEEAICAWLAELSGHMETVESFDALEAYAVVNGRFLAPEGERDVPFQSRSWYQNALAAEGGIVFSDAYEDSAGAGRIVTISKQCGGAVLAFDIYPENFRVLENAQDLPPESSYYLCDSSGSLLYADSALEPGTDLQAYMDGIFARLEQGELQSPESFVYDPNGRQDAVYYNIASNGWVSVITIPYRVLLEDVRRFALGYALALLLFLALAALMLARDFLLNRSVEKTNETVRVLGNSYYAIYRIDYRTGRYDMIKGSDYVRRRLPQEGDYRDFLKVAGNVIEKAALAEFNEKFSLENIHAMVAQRVRDFGGDFRRLFGEEYRWVNVRMLFDESLRQDEVVLCFREIEEEKQRSLRQMLLLKDSLESAKRTEEARNKFFSTMSHDMRTPLNAIIGLSELAEGHAGDKARTLDYLEKIQYSSRQLLTLINDILEMSRLEQGKLELDAKPFRLRECVNQCADVFRHQAQREKKRFSVRFEAADEEVLGDSFRLVQVLNNLLSNALKFTPEGGSICLQVRQVENQAHGKYQFVVQDTGAGMSPEFLKKLFVPYERETRFGARNVVGTGLGMPIVKSIVSQMGGEITVESRLGMGSTFTVTLPLETLPRQEAAQAQEEKAQEPPPSLEGRTILLAEDNKINMEIAKELLAALGARVEEAWNGREAVERFRGSAPFQIDAVLMDMQMPELNGCEAAKAIRSMKRPDAGRVPILAVTANAFAEDIAATTEAGMNAHISKPIDFAVLFQVLTEQIGAAEAKGRPQAES